MREKQEAIDLENQVQEAKSKSHCLEREMKKKM
jgi:hypothetical protein